MGFFGLTPDYREYLFTEIHEIVFWGQGGYSYDVIYNMPIWLRKFTFKKLRDHYQKTSTQNQEENIQKSIAAMKQAKADNIIPQKSPTYVTKASSKK